MKKHLFVATMLLIGSGIFAQSTEKSHQAIRMVDKLLNFSGMFNSDAAESFIGLDAGDKIVINCFRLSKKGSVNLFVKDLEHGNELYRKVDFDTPRNAEIAIPSKGIYSVGVKASSLLGRDIKLTVDRVAATGHKAVAKTGGDTTAVEVVNTVARVYGKNSPQTNTSVISINLPANTRYWVYWIGAGKDAKEKFTEFTASCSTIGNVYPTTDPVILYGKYMLSSLPMVKTSASISYHFMDTKNSNAFKTKQQYSFYMFKSSERITTEYARIPNNQTDLNLGISNESNNTAQDITVRVVAFIVKPK